MRTRITIISILLSFACFAQNPEMEKEVAVYRKLDSISTPRAMSIVFTGSSSFRLWKDIEADLAGYPVVNRGFGGSTLVDLRHWLHDLVLVHQPKQVVIYCGENDLAASDTVTGAMVADRFKGVFSDLRVWMPDVHIAYVSMKPSPSRLHLMHKVKEGNHLVREFLEKESKTKYIDVFSAMLDANGKPRPELFVEDQLHMNRQGYEIWKKLIIPCLLK